MIHISFLLQSKCSLTSVQLHRRAVLHLVLYLFWFAPSQRLWLILLIYSDRVCSCFLTFYIIFLYFYIYFNFIVWNQAKISIHVLRGSPKIQLGFFFSSVRFLRSWLQTNFFSRFSIAISLASLHPSFSGVETHFCFKMPEASLNPFG